jgi:hypothetical protein
MSKPTEALTNADEQAFENTSTSVAASQMRNALNSLADTVTDTKEKKVSFPTYLQPAPITLTLCLALRDGNGQLLCPLPPLPERQSKG